MEHSDNRILVAFDSRLGSTAEVASFIGDVLTERGLSVDVKPISEVDDLASYHGVVIGGAIRYDRWLSGAVKFTRSHQEVLQRVPVAFFFTCLTLAKPTIEAQHKANSYADQISKLLPDVSSISVGRFAGVLNFTRTPWPARLVLRILSVATKVEEGDYRDWDAIRAWATELSFSKNF